MSNECQQFLSEVVHGALATINEDGSPWVVPLHIFFDQSANAIVWFSHEKANHSANIIREPRVSMTAWGGTPSAAAYIGGSAYKLEEAKKNDARALVEAKTGSFPPIFEGADAYILPLGKYDLEKSTENRWYFYT